MSMSCCSFYPLSWTFSVQNSGNRFSPSILWKVFGCFWKNGTKSETNIETCRARVISQSFDTRELALKYYIVHITGRWESTSEGPVEHQNHIQRLAPPWARRQTSACQSWWANAQWWWSWGEAWSARSCSEVWWWEWLPKSGSHQDGGVRAPHPVLSPQQMVDLFSFHPDLNRNGGHRFQHHCGFLHLHHHRLLVYSFDYRLSGLQMNVDELACCMDGEAHSLRSCCCPKDFDLLCLMGDKINGVPTKRPDLPIQGVDFSVLPRFGYVVFTQIILVFTWKGRNWWYTLTVSSLVSRTL